MTTHREIIERIRELGPIVSESRRQALNAANHLAAAGDLAGAATAIDAVEQALHPALAAGEGGAEPTTIEGAAVAKGSSSYTGGHVAFNQIRYDPAGWWDSDANSLVTPSDIGELGLYVVSAQIRLDASGSISDVPEFEIGIGGTAWNYDPVLFEVVRAHDSNVYIGSVSLPLPISAECEMWVDGYWGGFSQSPSAALAGILSVFKIGTLAA